jgi:hypothetical protein
VLLAGCGSSDSHSATGGIPRQLLLEARPIGRGARFHPPATGPVLGACRPGLGPRVGVHIEVFAADRVVLVPAGIGTRPPLRFFGGRITSARCSGELATIDPTGLVLVRPAAHLTLAAVFREWAQPLQARRLVSFSAAPGDTVRAYVDGRQWRGAPGAVPLSSHAEIVLEVGPYVPPHHSYAFPAGS